MDILDRISPDEAHLPPSQRTWARVLIIQTFDCLELRDPNDGIGDPETCSRYQYVVARGELLTRRLPPAPLADHEDERPWSDNPSASRWRVCTAAPSSPVWEWSGLQPQSPRDAEPIELAVTADIDGCGPETYTAYAMPPADPGDIWASITGVPCPVPGCDHELVWYEAGYVPGYRVCMARVRDGYDKATLRHRFCLCHSPSPPEARGRMVIILDD